MAIDISTDLVIEVTGAIEITPTDNGIYDAGGMPGQYNPGKDFSETDNVSKNGQPVYVVNVSLNSLSNQVYPIDKLSVGFANMAGGLSTGTLIYFLNTNPNALDTVDDGSNTTFQGQATSQISVFTSGIQSNSTLSTQLVVVLPNETAWKTKIEPKIVVVAVKDGITKSQTGQLPAVRMAPKTRYVSTLTAENQNVTFSPNALRIPFQVRSSADRYPNQILPVIGLTNPTNFSSVTYRINLSAKVNEIAKNFNPSAFTFMPPAGFTVAGYSYMGGVLEFSVSGPFASIADSFIINVFGTVPYVPQPGETNASVTLMGAWNVSTPVAVASNDNYQILFKLDTEGSANYNAPFVDLTQGGIGALRIRHVLELNTINTPPPILPQYVAATRDDLFYVAIGSKYVMLIDSLIAALKPNAAASPVKIIYTDFANVKHTQTVNPSLYVQSFAHVGLNEGAYNPNVIAHGIVTGVIQTGTYASVIAGGKKPDVRMLTLTGDPWADVDFDPMKERTIYFDDMASETLTGTEFAELYATNPQADYLTYWYSYVSLNTDLASPEEGYADYGAFMAPMDSFEQRSGSVFLNLGTTQKGAGSTVGQFNDISIVQRNVGIYDWLGEIVYGLTNDFGIPVNTISNYTQAYCLRLTASIPNQFVYAPPLIKAGTPVVLQIPDELAPYLTLTGEPYVSDPQGNRTLITIFSYDGHIISFIWPNVDTILGGKTVGGMGGACFPVHFFPPTNSVLVQPKQPEIPPDAIRLYKPGFVTDGMPSSTPFFKTAFVEPPTTMIGLQVDNTGLTVIPSVYHNGNSVRYMAITHNVTFDESDYYTFITVPTNQYNEIETSNNNLPAYINKIIIFNPATEIYYQVAGAVTAADINISKNVNSLPNLMNYYNNTIKTSWIKWAGGALPGDVVMLSSFTPAVLLGQQVRIDYDVKVDVDIDSSTLYINEASIKYQSTGSGLQAHSNVVRIQNTPVAPQPDVVKSVTPSVAVPGTVTPVIFTAVYTLPASVNTEPATTIRFADVVNPALQVTSSMLSVDGSQFYVINNQSSGNTADYQLIAQIPEGQTGDIPLTVTLTIHANVPANTPSCTRILNQASMQVNTQTPILSNAVYIKVGTLQSVNDLFESIALMETALSHILNAEGEKLQKAIAIGTSKEVIAVNKSVEEVVKSITRLEMIQQRKLKTFPGAICREEE